MEPAFDAQLSLIKETILSRFSYDPETGRLQYLVDTWAKFKGEFVELDRGQVAVMGRRLTVPNIMWFLHFREWYTGILDHKDRDPSNNKISNLRKATPTTNQYNKAQPNPHEFKGVTWRNRKNPWLAKIRVDGKRINLGSFATKEEAALAYEEACLKYHGEFACLEIA